MAGHGEGQGVLQASSGMHIDLGWALSIQQGTERPFPAPIALCSRMEQSRSHGWYCGREKLPADGRYQTMKYEALRLRAPRDGDFQLSPAHRPPWGFTRVLEIQPHWPLHQCSESGMWGFQ